MKTPCQAHDTETNCEQLAVQWFIDELNKMSSFELNSNWRLLANKAITKSKQQMHKSFIAGGQSAFNMVKGNTESSTFEEYYNQNYI